MNIFSGNPVRLEPPMPPSVAALVVLDEGDLAQVAHALETPAHKEFLVTSRGVQHSVPS